MGVDPNSAYNQYGATSQMLAQSAAPGDAAALQAAAAQNAGMGLTNSSANSYNLGNLQAQQQAALLGQDASLLNTAQAQYGQEAMQNSALGTANNQFNAGAQNTAANLGYQGTLSQEGANQQAANTAGAYDATAKNQFTQQNMDQYNNWLASLQGENFNKQNLALQGYLGAFGDTSAGNVYQGAGAGETSAYNNAFNQQNASNNAWEGILGSAIGAGGQIAAGGFNLGGGTLPPPGSGFATGTIDTPANGGFVTGDQTGGKW
jgi:hypothetical protein